MVSPVHRSPDADTVARRVADRVLELVAEAGVIGLIGGLIGVALGAFAVFVGNRVGADSGTALFTLTAGTGLAALIFATVLGMAAGVVPAVHAARLDPVQALRYE